MERFIGRIDPETAHKAATSTLHWAEKNDRALKFLNYTLTGETERFQSDRLKVNIAGLELDNPLLIAAGFDKNAKVAKALYHLNFSSAVVGTVVPEPQAGNPRPRIHRVGNGELVNHMGFPSDGAEKVAINLENYSDRNFPIGVSIGPNKDFNPEMAPEIYAELAKKFHPLADYFEINVSSPNTLGLRDLQTGEYMDQIIEEVKKVTNKPIFIKIAPDLSVEEIDQITEVAEKYSVGITAVNTSRALAEEKGVAGGLSGPPLSDISNQIVQHVYRVSDRKIDIFGVGGIRNYQDVLQKHSAGARGVQLYTAFVYPPNPRIARTISEDMHNWMSKKGLNSVNEFIGQKL